MLMVITVTGCASGPVTPTGNLAAWSRDAGLLDVLTGISESLAGTAAELDGLGSSPTDVAVMVDALHKSAKALAEEADRLATQPKSSDAGYEAERNALVTALRVYVKMAAAAQPGDLSATTAAINALTAISDSVISLSTYIQEHGDDAVGAA